MNFFTDDHAGTETLRLWYCTGTVTVTWPNSSCRFLASSQMGWYGMDASDSDDNVFSTRTSAAPPHPPVDPSLSMSPLSAAGWRDVPSADIPSPLDQLRSQISSLFLSRHWKKSLYHYNGRNLNRTVLGKFVKNFGILNKFCANKNVFFHLK